VERTVAECRDDALRDDESMLQDLRILAEETKKALSTADTKTQIVRYSGTPAKITVSRTQFEQMTADLLDETIRITSRTLAEAEQKYPGIGQQISEVLLVGGSSKMPAVGEALRKEFGWDPRLADPDLAVAKGAALYAAGQTVRYVEKDQPGEGADLPGKAGNDDPAAAPGPVTEEAIRAVADQTGLREEDVRRLAEKTVVNVLPKAIGVKLIDTRRPGWQDDEESALFIEHLVVAQTQLPFQREPFVARTVYPQQSEIEIEIWEQAGGSPGRALTQNHPLDASGRIRGLGPFALSAGSPIHIDIRIDAEGTVHLRAVEPASRHEVQLEVRISILSAEQVVEAKRAHAGLTVST
jgi:molecular chaperone DnaK